MEPLKPGQNPRHHFGSHRERGPIKHFYTCEDIRKAVGFKQIRSIYQAKYRGDFDPEDLVSVAEYICRKRIAKLRATARKLAP